MLRRPLSFFLLACSFSVAVGHAVRADWSDSVFPVREHDFGTVAVAAKTEFRFPIRNTLNQELHIRSVRASCGCTTPIVETEYIQPGQTGSILARYNTDTFRGDRKATLTVVIDKPFYTEVRLQVKGYIRKDMVFDPGEVDFGKVELGTPASRAVTVYYAGRNDWKIEDVRSNQAWLQASFEPTSRGRGRVNYTINVTLREDAPAGNFRDELVVVTNDRKMPRVPLGVSGQIESEYVVSPRLISLGDLKPGESIEQRLVIRGRTPFTVEAIRAEGWDVEFEKSLSPKSLHILTATFTPGDVSGPQKVNIAIEIGGDKTATANALLTAMLRDR